ncbi:uncharacterized protein EI97DRAFT_470209 [Westerdykella ornata]|uniref:Uncharacterized protein n=1 Tax=Westerdykella ornata TaxID=318751 RepID=A0A6A6J8Z7_WESOR|nr:uncharacterized protein EI97DRAFT_470209 [Westerdykella ornata]KAF2272643.1 hypothetical protein EI97DRAFT_470209 [Westerdykella ornata]
MPDRDDDNRSRSRCTDPDREPNPFISFRRFADAQLSSLFKHVFPLSEDLDDHSSSSVSMRAQLLCLFGRADERKCERREELQWEELGLQFERESRYLLGHARGVKEVEEQMDEIRRKREELDRRICDEEEEGSTRGWNELGVQRQREKEMVERVANRKAQEWAWDWDWGFPRPFDARENRDGQRRGDRAQSEEQVGNGARGFWGRRRCARDEHLGTDWEEVKKWAHEEEDAENRPKVWHSCSRWLRPSESSRHGNPYSYRAWGEMYSPYSLENDERWKQTNVPWRDAYEDLLRTQRGLDIMPEEDLGKSKDMSYWDWVRQLARPAPAQRWPKEGQYPKRVPWTNEDDASEQPNYEYGHDHEDQHDEPPSPTSARPHQASESEAPATELDAYERLLSSGDSAPQSDTARPSLMSTLTTTERTIAPDGTVITKVVLKKRFADGREENSETVHTQRPQDAEAHGPDGEPQSQTAGANRSTEKPNNRSGWFWSK